MEKPLLSFCAIVKNERENLPRCLQSIRAYVDEIIIVDTGSEDNTKEIAYEYGAKVFDFTWCNDFAKAKNVAISHALGEWILMLDADCELIVKEPNFKEILKLDSPIVAYFIDLCDAYQQNNISVAQQIFLFRNIPGLLYHEPYHEQLKYNNTSLYAEQCQFLDGVQVIHYGYQENNLLLKAKARIEILEAILQKEFNLMTLLTLSAMYQTTEQLEKVEECYTQAYEYLFPYLLEGAPPEDFRSVITWLFNLGLTCLERKDYETNLLISQRALQWSVNYPPVYYLTGEVLRELGLLLGAIPYYEACLNLGQTETYSKQEPFDLNLATLYPAYHLGKIFIELKAREKAIKFFELALSFNSNFQPALQGLEYAKKM